MPFRLLVVTDLHYAPEGGEEPTRRSELGCELLRRALEDARRQCPTQPFDAVAILGDFLEDGDAPDAEASLVELRAVLQQMCPHAPVWVAPGNHDGEPRRLLRLFDQHLGRQECDAADVWVFSEDYAEDDSATRPVDQIGQLLIEPPLTDQPRIVLQHNPLYPPIDDEYPYIPVNAHAIREAYSGAGVTLSVSGHYHDGQPITRCGGVLYLTVPALCRAPYRYVLVEVTAETVAAEVRSLSVEATPGVVDCHGHTEFAYCGSSISAAVEIDRARMLGLSGVCLTEHAPQLYMDRDTFWQAGHIHEPATWRESDRERMNAFREFAGELRRANPGFVRVGLEVELDIDGCLTVQDEDREFADILVGAVHWLTTDALSELTNPVEAFQRSTEGILRAGVDVLAHPWRYFRRKRRTAGGDVLEPLDVPTELYDWLADLLAETGTAAEINFHTNTPDPAFFTACLRRGVKLAVGSDSHFDWQAGGFSAHLALLRRIAPDAPPAELLWQPPTR